MLAGVGPPRVCQQQLGGNKSRRWPLLAGGAGPTLPGEHSDWLRNRMLEIILAKVGSEAELSA